MTCKTNDTDEIRIGFDEPGYWSYIGNDSINSYLISHNLSSMNFQGFNTVPPDEPMFTGTVLHEFGHVLGLHHEHQSPASGCDAEYNWQKVYAYYQQQYNWDPSTVDENLKQLTADSSAYDWSTRDPSSIMMYPSNPQFLYKGTQSPCYFHANYKLSSLDVEGIKKAYSQQEVALHLRLQSQGLETIIAGSKIIPDALKSALKIQLELSKRQLQ